MQLIRRIFLVLTIPILLGGCYKESIPPLLTGDWLWEESSGGFAGVVIKPNPTERIILRFTDDGQFSVYQNDTLSYSGTFRLTTARSIYSGKDEPRIEVGQIRQLKKPSHTVVVAGVMSTLSASQLAIGDNVYDGYGSNFVRK